MRLSTSWPGNETSIKLVPSNCLGGQVCTCKGQLVHIQSISFQLAIFATAVSALVGWPFSAALG